MNAFREIIPCLRFTREIHFRTPLTTQPVDPAMGSGLYLHLGLCAQSSEDCLRGTTAGVEALVRGHEQPGRARAAEIQATLCQRRDWYRYSVGVAPLISRNTRAKCCWVLKPQAMATSSTRISSERNICFARWTRCQRRDWWGVWPVELRKTSEKCAVLRPTVRAISSRLKSSSIFSCTNSLILRNRAGLSPPR